MQDVVSNEAISAEIVELEEVIAYSVETSGSVTCDSGGDCSATVGAKTLW